jgi:hypothetical protein
MISAILLKMGLTLVIAFATLKLGFSFLDVDEDRVPDWVYVIIGFAMMLTVVLFAVSGILYLWY